MEKKSRSETNVTSAQLRSRFLWYAGIVMLVFVVGAFGAAALAQPFRLARYVKPQVIVHIVLALSWLGLFIVQSGLVGSGAIARHRKNVWLGALIALILTVHAIYLTYVWGDPQRFVGESRDVLAFAALFIAAVWAAKRHRFEAHKRLMFIGTLNLLGPAYTRLGFVFDWPVLTGLIVTLLTWILPPVIYDLLTRGAIHRASIAGIAFSIATLVLMIAIVSSPVMGLIEARLFP